VSTRVNRKIARLYPSLKGTQRNFLRTNDVVGVGLIRNGLIRCHSDEKEIGMARLLNAKLQPGRWL